MINLIRGEFNARFRFLTRMRFRGGASSNPPDRYTVQDSLSRASTDFTYASDKCELTIFPEPYTGQDSRYV